MNSGIHFRSYRRRDTSKRLRVYTDACDLLSSESVSQVPMCDLTFPDMNKRYKPLVFLSGHFSKSQLGGLFLEKKFAVM